MLIGTYLRIIAGVAGAAIPLAVTKGLYDFVRPRFGKMKEYLKEYSELKENEEFFEQNGLS